jgi:hypothetical protein
VAEADRRSTKVQVWINTGIALRSLVVATIALIRGE